MDIFYRNENIEIFKKWVYYKVLAHNELKMDLCNENTYKIFYKNKVAHFVVWPNEIIEESIVEDDELIFYLHYQFHNFTYATDLFDRMINKLLEENNIRKRKILLCCSGGMTTGYFAQRANQYCKLNQLPYSIDATGVDKAFKIYKDYEMILLAPQIHYQLKNLKEKINDCMIGLIEPSTFATYDCAKLVKMIQSFEYDDLE